MQWCVCVFNGQNQCDEFVVVVVVMPPSECQFTFGGNVEDELSVLGSSVVFTWEHAILGRTKVEMLVDGFGIRWIKM